MGFPPEVVDRMSLWEILACKDGWARAHGGKKGGAAAMSVERMRELGIEGV